MELHRKNAGVTLKNPVRGILPSQCKENKEKKES